MASSKKNETETKSIKEKPKVVSAETVSAKSEPTDQQTSSSSTTGSTQKQHMDSTRSLVMILAVVAMVVSLVYIYPYLSTMFGKQKEVFTSVDQLGQRHVALEEKVSLLEKKIAEMQDSLFKDIAQKDSVQLLGNRIEIIENQQKLLDQNSIEKTLGGLKKIDKQFTQTVESLVSRVEALEKTQVAGQNKISKIPQTILIFAELRDVIQTTKPFENELNKVLGLVDPDDTELSSKFNKLKEIAKVGAPSFDQIEHEFAILTNEFKRHSIPDSLPWYKKFVQRLRALVVVKKEGESILGGSNTDVILSEIHHELSQNDLEVALDLANKLPESQLASFTTWKARAENRYFIEEIYPLLETSALAYLLKEQSGKGQENEELLKLNKQEGVAE